MSYKPERSLGEIFSANKDRNIVLRNADAATRGGFTQVPNFILKSKKLSAGGAPQYQGTNRFVIPNPLETYS